MTKPTKTQKNIVHETLNKLKNWYENKNLMY